MGLLLDTQILVWFGAGDARLPAAVRERILDPDEALFVSAATAWEFADLEARGRFPDGVTFGAVVDRLDIVLLDLPASIWPVAATLPRLHLDPIDRMVVAHAIVADLTLVTADATMRAYPAPTLWQDSQG